MSFEDSNYLISNTQIVSSGKDNFYKIIERRNFDNEVVTGLVLLGGKYLVAVNKTTYIGNTSWSSIEYAYFEKVEQDR